MPELQLTKTQDLVPLVMDPFGQAAMSAMAMQEGSFGAGVYSSAGSMGKGTFLLLQAVHANPVALAASDERSRIV